MFEQTSGFQKQVASPHFHNSSPTQVWGQQLYINVIFQSLHHYQCKASKLRMNNIHIGADYLHLSEGKSDDRDQSKPPCFQSVSQSFSIVVDVKFNKKQKIWE